MHIQFSVGTMLWLLSAIAGGCIMIHGVMTSNPLEATAGLFCMSCCAGVLAAKLSTTRRPGQ